MFVRVLTPACVGARLARDGGLTVSQGFVGCVHIRFCGNGHLGFRPYGGSLSKSAKVTKALLPHHSAPRLGSACPHSGIAPWAAAKGHPWPSAATSASMPRCPLRNACVRPAWLTGRPRSTSTARRPYSRPDFLVIALLLWERACSRRGWNIQHYSSTVPSPSRASSLPQLDRDTTGRARSAIRPPREQALLPQF